jgi:hypothetical protein
LLKKHTNPYFIAEKNNHPLVRYRFFNMVVLHNDPGQHFQLPMRLRSKMDGLCSQVNASKNIYFSRLAL